MFDLGLITRVLDDAVGDAECLLSERRAKFKGYEKVGDAPLYEDVLRDAKRARAEFARLRKALEEAPVAALHGWSVTDGPDPRMWAPAIFLSIDGTGAPTRGPFPYRVRLVREDGAA